VAEVAKNEGQAGPEGRGGGGLGGCITALKQGTQYTTRTRFFGVARHLLGVVRSGNRGLITHYNKVNSGKFIKSFANGGSDAQKTTVKKEKMRANDQAGWWEKAAKGFKMDSKQGAGAGVMTSAEPVKTLAKTPQCQYNLYQKYQVE